MRPNRLGLADLGLVAATGLLFLLLLLAGCTTVGLHDHGALAHVAIDPQPAALSLCAYLDESVTPDQAATLLDEAWREEAPRYGITIRIVKTVRWKRPGFGMDGIMAALDREPLEPPCDRIMAFVGRHAGDVLWGLFLPQILGAVDGVTRTRGYVVARTASLDQAIQRPAQVLRHELYHMLGCDHELTLAICYERIAALKGAREDGFFPAWSGTAREPIRSRAGAGRLLASRGFPPRAPDPEPLGYTPPPVGELGLLDGPGDGAAAIPAADAPPSGSL